MLAEATFYIRPTITPPTQAYRTTHTGTQLRKLQLQLHTHTDASGVNFLSHPCLAFVLFTYAVQHNYRAYNLVYGAYSHTHIYTHRVYTLYTIYAARSQ